MNKDLFDYLIQPYLPSGSPHRYCIGNLNKCEVVIRDGAHHNRWSKSLKLDPNTHTLWLLPTDKQMQACNYELPSALSHCRELEFLQLPLAMLTQLKQDSLPAKLKNLQIVVTESDLHVSSIDWKLLKEMTSIRSIVIYNEFGAAVCKDAFQGIQILFPQLRYLSFNVTQNGNLLSSDPASLSNLHILVLDNPMQDTFLTQLPANLQALYVMGMHRDREADLERIMTLRQLRSLRLNSIRSTIDVEVFAKCPSLQELYIINSKKWSNPERLTELPLQNLTLIDCGNPLKKAKSLFNEQRYHILDIQFS